MNRDTHKWEPKPVAKGARHGWTEAEILALSTGDRDRVRKAIAKRERKVARAKSK